MTNLAKMARIVAALLVCAGCVSTETGTEAPKGDDKEAAQRHYQLGVEYYTNGNYGLARDRLTRAIEFDPDLAIAHTALALTYIQLENKRLAAENYRKAVKLAPNDVNARNAYAIFLCGELQYDEAVEQFDRAIRVYDNDEKQVMMTNAGVCLMNKPEYERAEQYFRDALTFKASYGEALLQLAILNFKTEDFLRARAFLQRYMVNNSTSASVLYLCSQIEAKLGDDRASTECMNDLVNSFPDSAEAQYVISNSSGQ